MKFKPPNPPNYPCVPVPITTAAQRGGKSWFAQLAVEAALKAGKTVVIGTPRGWERRKRYRHLTCITLLERTVEVSVDELYRRDIYDDWEQQ